MFRNFSKVIFIATIFIFSTALTAQPTCPTASEIKKLKLIEAIQHHLDPDVWNFASVTLNVKGQSWNVWFGTFLPGMTNNKEALQKGQAYYDQAEIKRTQPEAYKGTQNYYFCDYIPEGSPYWISAVNPPAYGTMP